MFGNDTISNRFANRNQENVNTTVQTQGGEVLDGFDKAVFINCNSNGLNSEVKVNKMLDYIKAKAKKGIVCLTDVPSPLLEKLQGSGLGLWMVRYSIANPSNPKDLYSGIVYPVKSNDADSSVEAVLDEGYRITDQGIIPSTFSHNPEKVAVSIPYVRINRLGKPPLVVASVYVDWNNNPKRWQENLDNIKKYAQQNFQGCELLFIGDFNPRVWPGTLWEGLRIEHNRNTEILFMGITVLLNYLKGLFKLPQDLEITQKLLNKNGIHFPPGSELQIEKGPLKYNIQTDGGLCYWPKDWGERPSYYEATAQEGPSDHKTTEVRLGSQ